MCQGLETWAYLEASYSFSKELHNEGCSFLFTLFILPFPVWRSFLEMAKMEAR